MASTNRFFLQVALLQLLNHLLHSLPLVEIDYRLKLLVRKKGRFPLRLDLSLPLRAPLVLQLLAHVAVNVVASSDWDSIACHRVGAQGGDLAAHTYAAAGAYGNFFIKTLLLLVL